MNQFRGGTHAKKCVWRCCRLLGSCVPWIDVWVTGSRPVMESGGGFCVKLAPMGFVPATHGTMRPNAERVAPWVPGTSPRMTEAGRDNTHGCVFRAAGVTPTKQKRRPFPDAPRSLGLKALYAALRASRTLLPPFALTGMVRGFSDSGTSRFSDTCSRPFSMPAPWTWT